MNQRLRTIIQPKFFLFVAIVFAIGFYGISLENWKDRFAFEQVTPKDTPEIVKVILDSIVETAQMFVLGLDTINGPEHWTITLARPLAALVSFFAVFHLLTVALRQNILSSQISRMSDHVVIFGSNEIAVHFKNTAHEAGNTVLMVRDKVDNSSERLYSPRLFVQDNIAANEVGFKAVNAAAAKYVVFAEDAGKNNLAGLQELMLLAPCHRENPLEALAVVQDPHLAGILQRQDQVVAGDTQSCTVQAAIFNPAKAAADDFIAKARLANRALANGQSHVHLVIIGDSDIADQIMLQAFRHSSAVNLGRPVIERIVAEKTTAENRLAHLCPALLPSLSSNSQYPPLTWAADWKFHEGDPKCMPIQQLIAPIFDKIASKPTAVVIADTNLFADLAISISLRDALRQNDWGSGPIFAHLPNPTSFDSTFSELSKTNIVTKHLPLELTNDPDIIVPFGRLQEICDHNFVMGDTEKLAILLHEAYREQRFKVSPDLEGRPDKDLPENLRSWEVLRETYRRSNRRAAANLDAKLASMSITDLTTPSTLKRVNQALSDDVEIENLASLEHDSWRLDREIEGWRYSETRDNRRKLHPDLKPYESLSDEIKEYDREQVRFILKFLSDSKKFE